MFDSDKLLQLKLYYLATCADGSFSPDERQRLNELQDGMVLSPDYQERFKQFCKIPVASNSVLDKVQALLDEEILSSLHFDEQAQAETIWNLINLGYADSTYSSQERQIVTYLASRWDIDELLVEELTSAAEAILTLVEQKKWVKETKRPYKEIEAMIQEIDRNLASLYEDTKASVFDADIA